jgi:hypothetical protein
MRWWPPPGAGLDLDRLRRESQQRRGPQVLITWLGERSEFKQL